MNVGVLIITHDNIGKNLLYTAENILQQNPLNVQVLGIQSKCIPEEEKEAIRQAIKELNTGDGVLVLTDIFGATPCNLVRSLTENPNIRLVTGLNLAMLIRIMNYPTLSLVKLSEKAISAGHDSIFECQS